MRENICVRCSEHFGCDRISCSGRISKVGKAVGGVDSLSEDPVSDGRWRVLTNIVMNAKAAERRRRLLALVTRAETAWGIWLIFCALTRESGQFQTQLGSLHLSTSSQRKSDFLLTRKQEDKRIPVSGDYLELQQQNLL